MVISFKLIKLEQKLNISKKYCIFSISESDDITKFVVFIEDKKLKIISGDKLELIFDNIKYNQAYILWIFSNEKNNKNETTFYLNNDKVIKTINYNFSDIISTINIGFQNNKQLKNFEGIIGTFILFNKCLLEDNNKIFNMLLKLKFNYEDIIYINYINDYSLLNDETKNIIDELKSDNISKYIIAIISNKSIINDNFYYNKQQKFFRANYFTYGKEEKNMQTLGFNLNPIDNCKIIMNYISIII